MFTKATDAESMTGYPCTSAPGALAPRDPMIPSSAPISERGQHKLAGAFHDTGDAQICIAFAARLLVLWPSREAAAYLANATLSHRQPL